MLTRTATRYVTFARPFHFGGLDAPQPAGTYVVETDEELLQGLSFIAYRRTGTRLQLPTRMGVVETIAIDPAELERALAGETPHE